jgi:hypothetical protein
MMMINVLADAAGLPDHELLARLDRLASQERETSAELVAHLAALEMRPALYAAQGFGSLFSYCVAVLHLSEDAACTRIEVARACRRFPALLDLLASGALTLTAIKILGRHLTEENLEAVLGRARHRTVRELEALVADLAPRPDAPSLVRRLPAPAAPASSLASVTSMPLTAEDAPAPATAVVARSGQPSGPTPTARVTSRPILQTAPERYRVQFTIGAESHARLRRLQALLRREIPSGDPGEIFDRAVALLLDKVEKTKLGATSRPRTRPAIRPKTDDSLANSIRTPPLESRHIPRAVKREVWRRDGGQCAFVSQQGGRCPERAFLEFHHVEAHAKRGKATAANISLRCRRHNQYESELVFGCRPIAMGQLRARPKPADGPPPG